jgi:hypothetical protein
MPTGRTVGPNNVVTNHCVEGGDHLAHDRNDHNFRQLAGLEQLAQQIGDTRCGLAAGPCGSA